MLGQLPLIWSSAQVVCDSPEKKRVAEGSMVGRLMYEPVARTAATVQSELLMITPYFVPTPEALQLLKQLRDRKVRIAILTNSLDSTTELSAQSGYARYRLKLLESGVEIYELRAPVGNARGSGETAKMSRHGNYGLHAKLFVFDREKLFIGSMNFDQRSAWLNTEIGLLIDSSELTLQAVARYDAMTQLGNAYTVSLRPDAHGHSQLIWTTRYGDRMVETSHEPKRNAWRGFEDDILRVLPIDDEL